MNEWCTVPQESVTGWKRVVCTASSVYGRSQELHQNSWHNGCCSSSLEQSARGCHLIVITAVFPASIKNSFFQLIYPHLILIKAVRWLFVIEHHSLRYVRCEVVNGSHHHSMMGRMYRTNGIFINCIYDFFQILRSMATQKVKFGY